MQASLIQNNTEYITDIDTYLMSNLFNSFKKKV